MNEIKTLILILFFSKTVVLTAYPVFISHDAAFELLPKKPISAITSGASLLIDVSSMVNLENIAFGDILRRSEELFPKGSIAAVLSGPGSNNKIELTYTGIMYNDESVVLSLSGDQLPTGVEWTKITITSSFDLTDVNILWKNYKH